MPHEDALLYQIENPMTDLEKEQALENEQAMAEYEQDGEIPVNSALWDDGPPTSERKTRDDHTRQRRHSRVPSPSMGAEPARSYFARRAGC
jgi:hypothetical protein